ncbi:helix-turn-helix domain-containing protein [Duganella sp. LX20W]|uniref:Helix-turn-helix domain-containing protein n=1 Tax=Rugamonas brunnea TaxID=2758569 RepID=A0A7W2ICY0_9BURK|nr:helix-turn-helix domain-containing protein [Rugamonas brunnea]MBA5638819.1 helix-turn-helix domain-containing protein [Rugamonas brunnea]
MERHAIMNRFTSGSPLARNAAQPANCGNCPARTHCLPTGMNDTYCAAIDQLVERRVQLVRGEHLYQMNEPLSDHLYAIRSGQFKTYHLTPEGEQRVTGFHMSGEFLGLDAIGLHVHRGSAVALTNAEVCEFSYHRLADAAQRMEPLSQLFHNLLSKELARQQDTTLLLRNGHADQKFANFLLRMSRCYAARGSAPNLFQLPMSRQEIGDFLGLTAATISRLICNFKGQGCIKAVRRNIIILDQAMLTRIATGTPHPAPAVVARVPASPVLQLA